MKNPDDIDTELQQSFWNKYTHDSKYANRDEYKIDPIVGVNGYYEYHEAEKKWLSDEIDRAVRAMKDWS